jgi:hypothetical protein
MTESWSAPGDPAALAAEFAGWDPLVEAVLEQVTTCSLSANGMRPGCPESDRDSGSSRDRWLAPARATVTAMGWAPNNRLFLDDRCREDPDT